MLPSLRGNSPGSHRQFLPHRRGELPACSADSSYRVSSVCFNRWTAGVGQFTEQVRFIAPDQTTVIGKSEQKFELKDATHHAIQVTVYNQVEFKFPGTYFIEVLVDDVMKLRYPVPLFVVQPPQPPQGGAPAAAGDQPAA